MLVGRRFTSARLECVKCVILGSIHPRDRRFFLLFLFLLIAVYAVIGYGVYQVIDALA